MILSTFDQFLVKGTPDNITCLSLSWCDRNHFRLQTSNSFLQLMSLETGGLNGHRHTELDLRVIPAFPRLEFDFIITNYLLARLSFN